jgi:hypothetical protein
MNDDLKKNQILKHYQNVWSNVFSGLGNPCCHSQNILDGLQTIENMVYRVVMLQVD